VSYIYVKKSTTKRVKNHKKSKINPKYRKLFAFGFFIIGISTFVYALFPIIKFQFFYSSRFSQIISPLSTKFYNQGGSIIEDNSTDYTQISNWFVQDGKEINFPSLISSNSTNKTYYLSIPKLKIKDALVEVGSMDLKKSLIQYPQTALPGQLGNTVVFGHSVLPQFYNPKAYMTIFSTVYTLKNGDEIFLKYDNIEYKYIIEDMFEVKPTDFSVLEQRYDSKYLTLVTCSPPGTYLRRLIVKAKLR